MSSSGNSRRKFKSSPTRQSDLSEFGAVSYCSLPRQARLDQYFPKNNPILDILLACIKESEVLDKAHYGLRPHKKIFI